jgi:hypothetical protein
VVVVLALSFALDGSGVAVEATTVSVSVESAGAPASTFATSVKLGFAPAATAGDVQLTVPAAPAGGVVQLNPLGAVSDSKVVPAGKVSLSEMVDASDGPLFSRPIVYVTFSPGATGSGESEIAAARSADVSTVVVDVELSSPGFASGVDAETVAVFESIVPADVLAATRATSLKPAPGPWTSIVPPEQVTVPFAPTGGVTQVKPAGADRETNAVPGGSVSVSVTPWAGLGPLLVTLIV